LNPSSQRYRGTDSDDDWGEAIVGGVVDMVIGAAILNMAKPDTQ
jgi:hypothetical protein